MLYRLCLIKSVNALNLLQQVISAGYCSDYAYPSTGSQAGGYDSAEDTEDSCKSKCLAVLPASSSFYLTTHDKKCGCSATTSGPCSVTSSSSYISYEIVTAFKVPVLIGTNCTS